MRVHKASIALGAAFAALAAAFVADSASAQRRGGWPDGSGATTPTLRPQSNENLLIQLDERRPDRVRDTQGLRTNRFSPQPSTAQIPSGQLHRLPGVTSRPSNRDLRGMRGMGDRGMRGGTVHMSRGMNGYTHLSDEPGAEPGEPDKYYPTGQSARDAPRGVVSTDRRSRRGFQVPMRRIRQ